MDEVKSKSGIVVEHKIFSTRGVNHALLTGHLALLYQHRQNAVEVPSVAIVLVHWRLVPCSIYFRRFVEPSRGEAATGCG